MTQGITVMIRFLGIVAVVVGLGAPAYATVISETIAFDATNVMAISGSNPVPVNPVFGSVTLTFDTALSYTNATTGITLNSLNIPLGSAIAFNYNPGVSNGYLTLGGLQNNVAGLSNLTNDFRAIFLSASTAKPTFASVQYSETADISIFQSLTGSVLSSVPEPLSLSLLGGGLVALGGLRRRDRKSAA